MFVSRASMLVLTLAALACGGPPPVVDGSITPPPAGPARTTLEPAPGIFNGTLTVTLRTDRPATIHVTTDGANPLLPSATRVSGPSPLALELTATTTLTFTSITSEGSSETVRTGDYTRAGGAVGTVAGQVIVGEIMVGRALALRVNGTSHPLPTPQQAGPVPFLLEDLESGTHGFLALAERNGDGNLTMVGDFRSESAQVTLDVSDPSQAAHEGLTLYLGASAPELATLFGTVTIPGAASGKSLSVIAVDPSSVSGDPSGLLEQFGNADSVALSNAQQAWPYAITDLEPGNYIPVPMINRLGVTGASMNLLISLSPVQLSAGDAKRRDMAFGDATISGAATMTGQGTSAFLSGAIGVRTFSLASGIQAMVIPVAFVRNLGGDHVASYDGRDLRENASTSLRAFVGSTAIASALQWAVNPLSADPAHSTVASGGAGSQTSHDFTGN